MTIAGYDVIGDIHGYVDPLQRLLETLGYTQTQGTWSHPTRTAIFVGDFVDRGPHQREVVSLARAMVERGDAKAVMGNHELNALAYHTPHPETGAPLRPHSKKNQRQHEAFLEAYEDHPRELDHALTWFSSLPLWLELDGLRVIHACWHRPYLTYLQQEYEGSRLTDALLIDGFDKTHPTYNALETLLKGKELELPGGVRYLDREGNPRRTMRVAWWDRSARTYADAYMGPDGAAVPDTPIEGRHLVDDEPDGPLCFVGHYWLDGTPAPVADHVVCVDYSVARQEQLVAYRWSGERTPTQDHFVSVPVLESRGS